MEELNRIVADLEGDVKYRKEQIQKTHLRLLLAEQALIRVKKEKLEELIGLAEFDVQYYKKQYETHINSMKTSNAAIKAIKGKIVVN